MTGHLSAKPLLLVILTFLTLGSVLAMHPPAAAAASVDGVLKLMPVPASVTVREGRFRIDESLAIGGRSPQTGRAFKAAARFMSRLAGRTGLFLKQDFLAAQNPPGEGGLLYTFEKAGALLPNEDESRPPDIGA